MDNKFKDYNARSINILIILSVFVFGIWYSINAYFNRYSVDDFWHGFKIYEMGFWGNIKYHYYNWEGSLSHVILASIPHIINVKSEYAFVFNFLTITLLVFSLNEIVKLILKLNNSVINGKYKIFITSLYITNVLFVVFDNKAELIYCTWLNLSYTLGLALFILGLKYYLEKKFILASFFFVFFAFNKINIAFEGLLISTLLWYLMHRKLGFVSLLPILLFTLALFVNIAAPGNFIRQELIYIDNISSHDFKIIFFNNLFYYIKSYIISFSFSFLLLFPLVKHFFEDFNVKRVIIVYYLLIALVFILFESVFFTIAFKEAGPPRTKIFLHLFAIIGGVLFSLNTKFEKRKTKYFFVYSILTLFLCINIYFIKFVPISIKYSKCMDTRNLIMIKSISINSKLILFNLAPESGILNSAWLNDEQWLNNVYRRYYTKDSTFQIQLY